MLDSTTKAFCKSDCIALWWVHKASVDQVHVLAVLLVAIWHFACATGLSCTAVFLVWPKSLRQTPIRWVLPPTSTKHPQQFSFPLRLCPFSRIQGWICNSALHSNITPGRCLDPPWLSLRISCGEHSLIDWWSPAHFPLRNYNTEKCEHSSVLNVII